MSQTPHMMGGRRKYAGWLTLKVAGLEEEALARRAKEALGKVEGVARVATYPKQQALAVSFSAEGDVASQQLIEVLAEAGLTASLSR